MPWLLFFFTLVFAAVQIRALPAEPLSEAFDDELHYAMQARDVATGHFPRYNRIFEPFVPPLYGTVQGPVRYFAGKDAWRWWSRAFNVLLLASSVAPIYLLGRRWLSQGWAALAAAVSLVSPSQVYARYILSENLYIPLFLWLTLAVARLCERPTRGRAAVVGVALACCFLTRTQAIAVMLAVLLTLIWTLRSVREVIKVCVPMTVVCLAILSAWWYRGLLFPSEWNLVPAFTYAGGLKEGGIKPLGWYAGWIWTTAGCFVIGLSTPVLVLGATGLVTDATSPAPSRRGLSTFVLLGSLGTLAMVGLATAQWEQTVAKYHERYLLSFWPLYTIAFVAQLRTTRVSWRNLSAVSLVVLAVALTMPPSYFERGNPLVNPVDFPSSLTTLMLRDLFDSKMAVRVLHAGLIVPALLWAQKQRGGTLLILLCVSYQGWGSWLAMERADQKNADAESEYRPLWNWLDGIVREEDVLIHHHLPRYAAYHNAMRYEMDYNQVTDDLTPTYASTVRLDAETNKYRFFDRGPVARFWLLTDLPGEVPVPGILSDGQGLRLIPINDALSVLGGWSSKQAEAPVAVPTR